MGTGREQRSAKGRLGRQAPGRESAQLTNQSARESYRQFLAATIQPIAKLVAEELADKLDSPSLALSFEDLRGADVLGRARAFASLTGGGMDAAKAAKITGLE